MVKSDQSDGESQDEMSALNVSAESVGNDESKHKRPRDDTSEDEKTHLPAKKLCTSINEPTVDEHKTKSVQELNGAMGSVKESKDANSLNNKKDEESKSLPKESTNDEIGNKEQKTSLEENTDGEMEDGKNLSSSAKNTDDEREDGENKSLSEGNTDDEAEKTVKKKTKEDGNKDDESDHSNSSTLNDNSIEKKESDAENKDSISDEPVSNADDKNVVETDEDEEKNDENGTPKGKIKKSRVKDAEVVEGLELSVECASDKEASSSSESDDEKNKKPKTKTIIVKAKPNESELDVSSSEAEKSELSEVPATVKRKKTAERGKKRGGRTSFSKTRSSGSEESNNDISDEDYSPRTKKRMKKATANKRSPKTASESKRGRGRGKRVAQRPVEKEVEEEEVESTVDVSNDKKTDDNLSDGESAKSKSSQSKSDSGSENDTGASKDGKRQRRNTNPDDDKRIQSLKKYIRAAGIYVKSYNELWAGYKTNAARLRCLKTLLEKNGITGRPTLEKCKRARLKNESLKDVAELNKNAIISEERITRARRKVDLHKEPEKTPETPTKQRETRNVFKRIRNVVDSDSE